MRTRAPACAGVSHQLRHVCFPRTRLVAAPQYRVQAAGAPSQQSPPGDGPADVNDPQLQAQIDAILRELDPDQLLVRI